MAFGSNSKIFRAFMADLFDNTTTAMDPGSDSFKCALFGNTGTPAQDATAASAAYSATASAWVTANEVFDVTNWALGGKVISWTTSQTVHFTDTAGVCWMDATDLASGGNVTVANVYGCLVYDDTVTTPVADVGMTFHSFGGSAQGVTAGTFTVVWDALGVIRITLS